MKSMREIGVQKMLWFAFTTAFLSVLFLSLFHMPAGMDMSGNMSDCPFMSHEEVLCSMNTLDHISAWKSAFTATAPSFALLLLSLIVVAVVITLAPNLLLRQRYRLQPLSREIRNRIYTFSYRPLQELFSSGILHPKLF